MKRHLILIALLFFSSQPLAAEHCLQENDTVTTSGTLSLIPYFGPPNYGEGGGKGDKKLQAWILKTSKAACVKNIEGKKDETEFQLIVPLDALKETNLLKLVGKTITVTGSLLEWQTGYHIRPFLIDVKKITSENNR